MYKEYEITITSNGSTIWQGRNDDPARLIDGLIWFLNEKIIQKR